MVSELWLKPKLLWGLKIPTISNIIILMQLMLEVLFVVNVWNQTVKLWHAPYNLMVF